MKDRVIYLPLIFLGVLALYLYTANAFIYYRIGHGHLEATARPEVLLTGTGTSTTTLTYAALGDSLTAGVGSGQYENAYPYLLAQKMAATGNNIRLVNFSAPGARSQDLIDRFLEPAIASRPDVVTVLIGVNDLHNYVSREQFRNNYSYILQQLTQRTTAKIYVINLPVLGSGTTVWPPLDYYFIQETTSYNKIIAALATQYQVGYIDLNTPIAARFRFDGPHYAADSFHPSAVGYKLWSDIIYDSLNQ